MYFFIFLHSLIKFKVQRTPVGSVLLMYTNQPHTTTRGSWHGEVAAVFSSLPLSTRGKTNILSVIFFFFLQNHAMGAGKMACHMSQDLCYSKPYITY